MPRKRADVLAGLMRKGFVEEEGGDHHVVIYYRKSDGKRTTKRTKASRGTSHKDISDINLANMARDVGVPKSAFLQLIDCPLSREDYEKLSGI